MPSPPPESPISLVQQVESLIRQRSFGRIRDLAVEEVQGRVVVRGQVPSQYLKQLVLLAALEVLPSGRLETFITVK
jgi:hypothetical protein